jgi:Domain of unknown function (DUF4333)
MSVVRSAALALATVAAAAAAGCGSDTVDATQVEQGIETDLSTASVKVTSASCPSDVEKQNGSTFSCTVRLSNDAKGKATVTQQGANSFTYAFTPGSMKVPGTTVDAAIEKSLAAQGAPNATASCPETISVKVGSTVTCDVSGAQGVATGSVTYTFSEANGTVDPASGESA